MSKVYPTCLTRNYVSRWEVPDSIREFIQNALDCGEYDINRYGNEIVINSYRGTINAQNLLLGVGSKTNDSTKIGGFSEGLLLALLIVARENTEIKFINGDKKWTPTFDWNEDYKCETLYIIEEDSDEELPEGVSIALQLSQDVADKVEQNTLYMQDDYEKFETDEGTILLDPKHAGKIYVSGLFVDNFRSEYGFNFPPECFALDRDRKSLNPWDVKWQIRQLINQMNNECDLTEGLSDRIIDSIANNDEAFSAVDEYEAGKNEKLVSSAEKLYNSNYSGKLVVSDYDEAKKLEKAGNKNVEFVSNSKLVSLIQKTESHQTVVLGKVEPEHKDVDELLEDFEDKYGSEMSSEMFDDWEELRKRIQEEL